MVMNVVSILGVAINLYSFAILIRIILSWFPEHQYRLGRVRRFFVAVTNPYLGMFRRMRFLHIGSLDISPVVAIVTLGALQVMLAEWARRGARSILLFPVFFASAMLNVISLFALLLFLVIIVRIILVKVGVIGGFTVILDRIFQPMILRMFRIVGIKRSMSFTTQLLLFAVTMLILFFGLRLLSAWLFLL